MNGAQDEWLLSNEVFQRIETENAEISLIYSVLPSQLFNTMKLIFYFEQAKDKMAIQGETYNQSNPKEGIRMQ